MTESRLKLSNSADDHDIAPMSEVFRTWTDVELSTGFAGATWSELQMRCAPGGGPGQTQGGWISDGAPIMEVLRKDWAKVHSLNTTHIEVAAHLDAIWDKAHPCAFDNPGRDVTYNANELEGNTLATFGSVQLKLTCTRTRGVQQDLLDPYNFSKGWNTEWTLNDGRDQLVVGGRNSSYGLLHYVRLFGFYEGGQSNTYRLDPVRFVAMLTNSTVPQVSSLISDGRSSGTLGTTIQFHILPICLMLAAIAAVAGSFWFATRPNRSRRGVKSNKKRNQANRPETCKSYSRVDPGVANASLTGEQEKTSLLHQHSVPGNLTVPAHGLVKPTTRHVLMGDINGAGNQSCVSVPVALATPATRHVLMGDISGVGNQSSVSVPAASTTIDPSLYHPASVVRVVANVQPTLHLYKPY